MLCKHCSLLSAVSIQIFAVTLIESADTDLGYFNINFSIAMIRQNALQIARKQLTFDVFSN